MAKKKKNKRRDKKERGASSSAEETPAAAAAAVDGGKDAEPTTQEAAAADANSNPFLPPPAALQKEEEAVVSAEEGGPSPAPGTVEDGSVQEPGLSSAEEGKKTPVEKAADTVEPADADGEEGTQSAETVTTPGEDVKSEAQEESPQEVPAERSFIGDLVLGGDSPQKARASPDSDAAGGLAADAAEGIGETTTSKKEVEKGLGAPPAEKGDAGWVVVDETEAKSGGRAGAQGELADGEVETNVTDRLAKLMARIVARSCCSKRVRGRDSD